ncbi:MAG: SPOR domain-containing protein, partial [Desulfosalsimonas sp.]
MKNIMRRVLICVVACCVLAPAARAQQEEVELQFGAYQDKSQAEEYADYVSHQLRRTVYVAPLNGGDETYYAVRTGPFDSTDQARSFIEKTNPSEEIKTWIMKKNSMKPALAGEFYLKPQQSEEEKILSVSESGPAGQNENPSGEPENPENEEDGEGEADEADEDLWGEAEEEDGDDQEASGPAPSSEVEDLREQVKELQEQVRTLLDAEDVRGVLEESEEEEREKEEDVLSAAGRQYTLLQKGKIGLEYEIEYGYYPYDQIREQNIIEHSANHSIRNAFTLEYPLKDNLTLEADIPFVYKYDRVGADDSKNVSDFGDVDFGMNYQPIRSGGGFPSVILRTTLTTPMGRSPYDINPDTELSTGSGGYALSGAMSLSKSVDPVMVYGTLGYEYKFPIRDLDFKLEQGGTLERYDRGNSIEVSMGMGYSLSYNTSITLGYSYTYTLEAKRYFKESEPQTYPTRASSSLSIGTSWRISPKFRINM